MRLLRVLLLLGIMIGLWGVTVAQDVNCGDLSAADCTLLTESSRVMGEIESGILHLDLNMTVDSGVGGNVVTSQIRGDGGFTIDRDAYNDLINGPITDAAIINNIVAVLTGSSLDISLLLNIPGAAGGLLGTSSVAEVGTLDIRLVDGVFYLNTDKLSPSSGLTPVGWVGIDLNAGIEQILAPDVGTIGSSLLLLRTAPAPDFSLWTRADDISIDGQMMAVFEQVIAFADLIADPIVRRAIEAQIILLIEGQGLGAGFSQSELQTAATNYAELFVGLTMTFRQVVGIDDFYVYSAMMIIDWQPSTDAQLDVLGGPDPLGFGLLAVNMHLEFTLDVHHHNQIAPVSVPANATVIPLDTLLGF